jgi:cathepsin B
MKFIILALLVASVFCSIVDDINNSDLPWKAREYEQFKGKSLDELRAMFGTRRSVHNIEKKEYPVAGDIPDSFDARTKWPDCVHPIRNQQQCGSCWAFGATEAASDRFCIASAGKINVILSPQDLVSCDHSDDGCQGGWPSNAWEFMVKTGLVTDTCYPYSSGGGNSGACKIKAEGDPCPGSGSETVHFYKMTDPETIHNDTAATQTEIMTNGPVEVDFSVYQDFINYKEGVYVRTSDQYLGGHAVKMLGWGVDDKGVPYWICANSWGPGWGLNGYFWIKRGDVDECGIQDDVNFGTPIIN